MFINKLVAHYNERDAAACYAMKTTHLNTAAQLFFYSDSFKM